MKSSKLKKKKKKNRATESREQSSSFSHIDHVELRFIYFLARYLASLTQLFVFKELCILFFQSNGV